MRGEIRLTDRHVRQAFRTLPGQLSGCIVGLHEACALRPDAGGCASGRSRSGADSKAVTGDDEDAPRPEPGAARARLRAVSGPLSPAEPRPAVRLWREWKGWTVADLWRDEIADRLPGQVRSALRHAQRGDWQRADAALPGEIATVLPGPRAARGPHRLLIAAVAIAAVLAAIALATWMGL